MLQACWAFRAILTKKKSFPQLRTSISGPTLGLKEGHVCHDEAKSSGGTVRSDGVWGQVPWFQREQAPLPFLFCPPCSSCEIMRSSIWEGPCELPPMPGPTKSCHRSSFLSNKTYPPHSILKYALSPSSFIAEKKSMKLNKIDFMPTDFS